MSTGLLKSLLERKYFSSLLQVPKINFLSQIPIALDGIQLYKTLDSALYGRKGLY